MTAGILEEDIQKGPGCLLQLKMAVLSFLPLSWCHGKIPLRAEP